MNKIKIVITKVIVLILLICISEISAQDFWTKLPGPEGGWIFSSAIDTSGGMYDGTIFIGTRGGGIFRSIDNGDNWIEVNEGLGNFFIYDIAIGSSVFAATDGGVFRSDDNGDSWQLKENGIPGGFWRTLFVDQTGNIYAGNNGAGIFYSTDNGENWSGGIGTGLTDGRIRTINKNSAGELFTGGYGGVHRSGDNGTNWTQIVNGMSIHVVSDILFFHDGTDENIIATTGDAGVFKSINNGDLWIQSNNGMTTNQVLTALVYYTNDIFLGTYTGIYKSSDYGNNWISIGLIEREIGALLVNNNNELIAGTNQGNFKSQDGGNSWNPTNSGLNGGPIFDLDVNSSNNIFLTRHEEVFTSVNNGINWNRINNGLIDTAYFEIKINNADDIFVGTENGIFRSDDNGNNWVFKGLSGEIVEQIEFNNSGHVFAGTAGTLGGLFRSEDNGETWTHLSNLPINDAWALSINQTNNTIFAGHWSDGIYRSTDNGDTWTQVNNGLTTTQIQTIVTNDVGHVFAGSWGSTVSLFRSLDNGNNWTEINNGLTNQVVNTIAINPIGHLYIGGSSGDIFFSIDNGNNWNPINNGMPYPTIFDMILDHNNFVMAATSGGMFISIIPTVLPQPVLSLPNDGATSIPINPTLEWNPVIGAESYHLQVSDVNDFSNIEFDQGGLTVNSQQISGLNTGTNYYWRVRAENFTGASDWSGEWSFTTFPYPQIIDIASGDILFPTHDNVSNYDTQDYRIVGIPGRIDADMKLDQIIDGVVNSDWQAYLDNGADSQNPDDYLRGFDGSDDFRFGGGHAFWVINKGNLNINKTGVETAILDSDGDAEIHLHIGWNLITNPFHIQLPWWQVEQTNTGIGPIYLYDGTDNWPNSANDFTFFEPYVGYYIDSPANMTLIIPYSATLNKPLSIKKHIWQLDIVLSMNEINKSSSRLGVSEQADYDCDNLDYRKPRAVGSIPSVYFYRPEWDGGYGIFATDYRPQIENIENWGFSVTGSLNQKTTLTFSEIEEVPEQHEIYLLDEIHSLYVNLREQSKYSFVPVTEVSNFVILVGNQEAVNAELDKVIPTEFELGNNFPNPFNPSTVIPISLPEQSEILIKVYDILGQEIKTLFRGTKEAGKHYFKWDATNYLNQQVAAGIYLYRLSTQTGHVFVGKMVLVK